MNLWIAIATTYKDILNNDESGTIYNGLYTLSQYLLQGIFSTLKDAGLYLAGSVITFLAAMLMLHGKNVQRRMEIREDIQEKLVIILFMSSIVSLVAFIITSSYGTRI